MTTARDRLTALGAWPDRIRGHNAGRQRGGAAIAAGKPTAPPPDFGRELAVCEACEDSDLYLGELSCPHLPGNCCGSRRIRPRLQAGWRCLLGRHGKGALSHDQ